MVIKKPPYCGVPPLPFSTLFRRDPAGGALALFKGRRVAYSINARAAIRKACDLLGIGAGDVILAPAYNCGSEIDPLLDAGAAVEFYPVDQAAQIDVAEVERRIIPGTRAIYLTHYFGFAQPAASALRGLCDRHGLFLIEDCALRLFRADTAALPEMFGDVAIFCFYKFFPVAGGGALVVGADAISDNPKFDCSAPRLTAVRTIMRGTLARVLGPDGADSVLTSLKHVRRRRAVQPVPDSWHRSNVDDQPDIPDHYYFNPRFRDVRISWFARRPLGAFDVASAIAARRANYMAYLSCLSGVPGIRFLFPTLSDDACPLSLPILVTNRDELVRSLIDCGIAATPWWSGYHRKLSWDGFADARFLKDHVMSLPVHQFMGDQHISYIAEQVCRLVGNR